MAGENTKIYHEQGGDRLVTKAGGTIVQEAHIMTVSGAVPTGTQVIELNHASVIIAATLVVTPNSLLIIKDTSATGTAAHNVTLTGGTFNGSATVATLNARDEMLVVFFDSAGRGQIVSNVGAVALS